MVLPKFKKIFLLVLLLLISFVLSAIKFISGEKISKAQAECWTSPPPTSVSSGSCAGGIVSGVSGS